MSEELEKPKNESVRKLYQTIELPLVETLASMEMNGILVCVSALVLHM